MKAYVGWSEFQLFIQIFIKRYFFHVQESGGWDFPDQLHLFIETHQLVHKDSPVVRPLHKGAAAAFSLNSSAGYQLIVGLTHDRSGNTAGLADLFLCGELLAGL